MSNNASSFTTALFKNQWQLKTASQSDYIRLVDEKFRPILRKLEDEVIASELFEPAVVYGYFPAQSHGNDVIVYQAPAGAPRPCRTRWDADVTELLRFTFPASAKAGGFASPISSCRSRPARWTSSASHS